MISDIAKKQLDNFESTYYVQCPHCKGNKGRTIKMAYRQWASCPNCGCALDIMNKHSLEATK